MKKLNHRVDDKVRQLCRDISRLANDREKLQALVIQLQQTLGQDRYETRAMHLTATPDDPFDKIMVG